MFFFLPTKSKHFIFFLSRKQLQKKLLKRNRIQWYTKNLWIDPKPKKHEQLIEEEQYTEWKTHKQRQRQKKAEFIGYAIIII